MQFTDLKTVREIAIEVPGATRVFEKLGIDYCCGGARPITEACKAASVTVAEVARALEQVERSSQVLADVEDWQAEPLESIITHIVNKHHRFTREALDGIDPLFAKSARPRRVRPEPCRFRRFRELARTNSPR
jgi:regulator of cell morphogenesis and NO signaling